jgi:hypothetical protein
MLHIALYKIVFSTVPVIALTGAAVEQEVLSSKLGAAQQNYYDYQPGV